MSVGAFSNAREFHYDSGSSSNCRLISSSFSTALPPSSPCCIPPLYPTERRFVLPCLSYRLFLICLISLTTFVITDGGYPISDDREEMNLRYIAENIFFPSDSLTAVLGERTAVTADLEDTSSICPSTKPTGPRDVQPWARSPPPIYLSDVDRVGPKAWKLKNAR